MEHTQVYRNEEYPLELEDQSTSLIHSYPGIDIQRVYYVRLILQQTTFHITLEMENM